MSAVDFEQFREKYGKDKLLHPENSGRLIEWMNDQNISPITVMICPTDRCQHACPLCVGGRVGTDNLQNMNGIVGQLAEHGIKSLVISGGGEPLLNKETPEAIEFARNLGLDVGLITNGGVHLPDDKTVKLIKNSNWIRISMDASNPQEYAHSHGMNEKNFVRMVDNARNMAVLRDRHGLTGCDIGVGYLTDDTTKNGMVSATKISKEIGLSYIQFRPFFYNQTITDAEFAECQRYADGSFRVLRSEYRYDKDTLNSRDRGYKKCLSPNFETTIAASGNVYICCHTLGSDNYNIGNINQKSFKDIWENEDRKKAIDSITFKDCPPICKWHVTNNVLYSIKDLGITTDQIQEISDSRHGEVYPTVKIL